jgi:putative molybdopterin biosynthesis protein
MAPGNGLDVLLRSARLRVGLSQGELAARAGVTRQAISAIESGKAMPTIGVALRLARALGQPVDEIFRLADERPSVTATVIGELGSYPPGQPVRVQVANIQGRLVARPLTGLAGTIRTLPRANGLLHGPIDTSGVARVALLTDLEQLERTVIAVGCDPAMGLLADHLRRRHPTMDLVHQGSNSLLAIEAVARGEAHLAGSHLRDPASGEYNVPFVRQRLGADVTLVTFAIWEQGLMVATGNPKGIHTCADLARAEVRFVNREPGSGARALLETELARLGLSPTRITGFNTVVRSHLAAAEAVAAGLADAAIGIRAAAHALGLDFIPLARERYDLVIPSRFHNLPAIQALLETLSSSLLRHEVEALGGYDVTPMGNMVAAAA